MNRKDKDENNCSIPSPPFHPSVWFGCIFSAKMEGVGTLEVRGFSQVPPRPTSGPERRCPLGEGQGSSEPSMSFL